MSELRPLPETAEELRAIVEGVFSGDKYRSIEPLEGNAGTRVCFKSEWGLGGERMIIKIDKNPESPRAIRHVGRGCNTDNDIHALSRIEDPEKHHLIRLLDFENLSKVGYDGTISVDSVLNNGTIFRIKVDIIPTSEN